ncbi:MULTISPECIES: hypothetical protein [unclassified Ensifer]|uniref:hypothetical protein n=1 Tax=unclassified Ensifer TaxID=2633371 RepID=UPI000813C7AC|nr:MULTISPECIES: hypothetical protein [unclassified Ensifer]OCP21996.1 hypothetical protein BC361_25865 [Ensifer sp. LC54]OCP23224.1 hypothetical protein BC363_24900 [Ensifer sp. LC384]
MASKKEKQTVTEEEKAFAERAGRVILEKLKALDEVYSVEGMHSRSVMKIENGKSVGYRTKALQPESDHLINDFFVGAKGQLVFKAYPADSTEYEWADVDEASMDKVFPLVGASLADALDIKECEDFSMVVRTVKERLAQEDLEAADAAAEEKKQADKAYETNPNFGRF